MEKAVSGSALVGRRHDPATCQRVGGLEQRYSFRNWSDRFKCPECGNSRRFSINFLGSRKLICDGVDIKTEKKEVATKFVSWKDDPRYLTSVVRA